MLTVIAIMLQTYAQFALKIALIHVFFWSIMKVKTHYYPIDLGLFLTPTSHFELVAVVVVFSLF